MGWVTEVGVVCFFRLVPVVDVVDVVDEVDEVDEAVVVVVLSVSSKIGLNPKNNHAESSWYASSRKDALGLAKGTE